MRPQKLIIPQIFFSFRDSELEAIYKEMLIIPLYIG
jgi:hypothetical protein